MSKPKQTLLNYIELRTKQLNETLVAANAVGEDAAIEGYIAWSRLDELDAFKIILEFAYADPTN